ncbi:MAG: glutathione ABC transporter permease GsiC [Myxococcales bacterium]|nr:glutathione ABC transporter permease GsiC [Myxococcales bacterium]
MTLIQIFLRRLPGILGVLFGASLLVSATLRLVPGDPVDLILGEEAHEVDRQKLTRDLGLDRSFPVQYGLFLKQLVTGELRSYRSDTTVFEMIGQALPHTVILALLSVALSLSLGIGLGIIAALNRKRGLRGQVIDFFALLFAYLGVAIPRIWLGPVLLLVFAVQNDLFPVGGADAGWRGLVLPVLSLGTAMAAMLARMTRACLLEVLGADYVRTARAKGLAERVVIGTHALRNALIPVITIAGLQMGGLLAGAVVTEKIFNWPGIGTLLLDSIQKMDFPVVQAVVLLIAGIYVMVNLVVDLLYGLTDPRVRL